MEHITGLSLDYLGEKLHSTGHRYTEDELKGLLTRLLRILDYLHSRHIYHRDIKPGNILLTEEGTPVLIDFGAARHALKLHAATVLTTQGYSSPEQALGKTNIGPWSDLYSVGATFYALLTGNPPDRAEARLAEDEMQPLHSDPVLTRYYSRQFLLSLDKALARQTSAMPIRKECQLPAPGKTSAAERPPPERTVFIPPHAGSPHALFAATAT